MLVEVTTVEQLIERLRKGKYKSTSEILHKSTWSIVFRRSYIDSWYIAMIVTQASNEDDDIVAGHQKMSLKCPVSPHVIPYGDLSKYLKLSYMRITTPTRSIHCVHSQCFDAFSWFSMMEQTTTWLCPVCEKVLNTEDLMVDG